MSIKSWGVLVKEKMGVPPSAKDLDTLVAEAERDVAARRIDVRRAVDALDAGFDAATDSGDEVGLRRLRDAKEKAERAARDAVDTLARVTIRRDRARDANRATEAAKLRVTVERVSREHRTHADALDQATLQLVGALLAYLDTAQKLRLASDALLVEAKALAGPDGSRMLTAVAVPDYPATFATEKIVGLLAQDLAVQTSGRWPARGVLDMHALSQGPRFNRRVAEELAILLRELPHPPTGSPVPPAA